MKIFDPKFTGSIEFLNTIVGNVTFGGDVTVEGTINATIEGTTATASYVSIDDVDGFSSVSESIASRLENQEAFSSSLDATFATDAQVATAVSSLNQATSSYALQADISGAFASTSSSLALRIASQEAFSSSLDATFATDAQVSTAVAGLNQATSSYALIADISGALGPNAELIRSLTAVSISGSNILFSSSIAERVDEVEGIVNSLNQATSSYALQADISGAFTSTSSSLAGRVSPLETSVSALNSASSSYLLNTTDTLVGDLTVTGKITAQEFHTEFVSASIVYQSGSTKFGDTSDDIHTFTGTGSFDKVGIGTTSPSSGKLEIQQTATTAGLWVRTGGTTDSYTIADFRTGTNNSALAIKGDSTSIFSGNIGIGITPSEYKLDVNGTGRFFGQGIFRTSSVPAIQAIRDLNVVSVGTAGQGIEFGALNGTTPTAGAAIYGGLDNPATTGNLVFQTLTGGSLTTKLTIASSGAATFTNDVILQNGKFLQAARNTGGAIIDIIGIQSGSDTLQIKGGTSGASNSINFYDTGGLIATFYAGRLGIGTTSPGDKLHIYSSTYDANIRLTDAGVTNADWSLLPSSGTDTAIFRLYNRATATVNQTWTPDGNVGIGQTNPAYKLQVSGVANANDIVINNTTTGINLRLQMIDGNGGIFTTGDKPLYLGTNNTANQLVINSSGNVGIGTTSPALKVHIIGTSTLPATSGTTQNGGIRIENGANNGVLDIGASSATGAPGWLQATDKADLSQTYNLLLNPNGGNVGIGASTTPVYMLEVSKASGSQRIRVGTLQNNDNTSRFEAITSNGLTVANSAWLRVDDSGGFTLGQSDYTKAGGDSGNFANLSSEVEIPRITVLGNGNVGIGATSPTTKLEVNGGTPNVNSYADGALQISGTSSPLAFVGQSNLNPSLNRWGFKLREANDGDFSIHSYTASSTRILINSSGNVGINQTSPRGKFDVTGGKIVHEQDGSVVERYAGAALNMVQNEWYNVYTFNLYELTCFFLLVGFEDNTGDSNNVTAIFVDSGSNSYGTGFGVTRLTGSTAIEAQRSSDTLQVRCTQTGGTNRNLHWTLVRIDGT